MNSTVKQTIQDILDGKFEVSYTIQQILENEENQKDLQDNLSILENIFTPILENISSWLTETSPDLGDDQDLAILVPALYKTLLSSDEDKKKNLLVAETIINAFARPVLFIRNDKFVIDDNAKPLLLSSLFDKLTKAPEKLEPAIKAVGAIQIHSRNGYELKGTGWLIAPDIIVTNRHVAEFFCVTGKEYAGELSFKPGFKGNVYIDFKVEDDNLDEARFKIEKILYIEDVQNPRDEDMYPDIAFLQVSNIGEGDSGISLPTFIPLSEDEIKKDMDVAVIGYPGELSQQYYEALRSENKDGYKTIFQNKFKVKRFQPGKILNLKNIQEYIQKSRLGNAIPNDGRICHDCTTIGGNSGSVIIDIDTGKALGVHFGGRPEITNYAVSALTINKRLADISR